MSSKINLKLALLCLCSLLVLSGTGYAVAMENEPPKGEKKISEDTSIEAHASDEKVAALQKKILQLKTKMEKLNQQLIEKGELKSTQMNRLKKLEVQIKKQTLSLAELQQEIAQHETALNALKETEQTLNNELASQKKMLSKQLKMAYLLSKTSGVKILLSQQSPHTLDRLLRYHQVLKKHSTEIIEKNVQLLNDLQLTKNKIEEEYLALAALKNTQETQMSELKTLHRDAEETLISLQKEMDIHQQQLTEAKQAEQVLKSQLTTILDRMKDHPPALPAGLSFEQAKGQLLWPLNDKPPSTSFANPFMIRATAGQEVRAIYHGRVVFSEWLRGFGLLLIIDHGGGYMSLYGNNQTLYKNVGESVNPGQLIAQVGSVSESSHSGLYFEIRKNGQTIRSKGWFK